MGEVASSGPTSKISIFEICSNQNKMFILDVGCCMNRRCEIRLRTACVTCTCFITPDRSPCWWELCPASLRGDMPKRNDEEGGKKPRLSFSPASSVSANPLESALRPSVLSVLQSSTRTRKESTSRAMRAVPESTWPRPVPTKRAQLRGWDAFSTASTCALSEG